MRSLVLGNAALLAIGVSIPTRAADMPVKAPPPAAEPAPCNWSGLYLGANFGGAWSNGSLIIPGSNLYGGLSEFIGEAKSGTMFRRATLFGVEGTFDGATFSLRPPTPTLGSVSQNWVGTIAGRVGVAEDLWLVYGKLGGGWVHSDAFMNFAGQNFSGSHTSGGWLAGVGLEYGFKPL